MFDVECVDDVLSDVLSEFVCFCDVVVCDDWFVEVLLLSCVLECLFGCGLFGEVFLVFWCGVCVVVKIMKLLYDDDVVRRVLV